MSVRLQTGRISGGSASAAALAVARVSGVPDWADLKMGDWRGRTAPSSGDSLRTSGP